MCVALIEFDCTGGRSKAYVYLFLTVAFLPVCLSACLCSVYDCWIVFLSVGTSKGIYHCSSFFIFRLSVFLSDVAVLIDS